MMQAPASVAAATCPHCAVDMREVAARARTGYLILLDQCPQCGGVWCDRWELFPLAPEDAARIDAVDEQRLAATAVAPRASGRCPRCTSPLQPFRDPMLPLDARIERCRVCDGMWMNRGELAGAKRRSPPTRITSDAALAQLAGTIGSETKWAKVANLDAATYAVDDDDGATPSDTRALLWSSVPWIVLRALLRLVLRV
jgi:Zn-finger nucleic acid-binding protein